MLLLRWVFVLFALLCFWCVRNLFVKESKEFKTALITSFTWLLIPPYSVQIRENTDQKKLRIWTLFTQCGSYLIYTLFSNIHQLTDAGYPYKNPATLIQKFCLIFSQNWVSKPYLPKNAFITIVETSWTHFIWPKTLPSFCYNVLKNCHSKNIPNK